MFYQMCLFITSWNDNYDTNKEDNDIAPFKHILNEMYAKDISKKVRSSRKVAAKQGKFMGSITPFGYKRSDIDRHKLVIDEPAAKVVKQIFELFKNHESARYIANKFNNEGIPNPHTYYYQRMKQDNPYKKNAKTWSSATITSILKNESYLGHMIQSKRAVQSFKTKKIQQLPPEMWIVVTATHEPIIDNETWSAVQLLFSTHKNVKPRKTALDNDASLFSNLIFCKDCNSKLAFGSTKRATFVDYYYRCSRYVQHGQSSCSPHRIKFDTICKVVLEDIKSNAKLAKEDEEAFIEKLHKINLGERHAEIDRLKKRETQIKGRQAEIDNLIQKTFEKNCNGILPDNMLANLLQRYEKEKVELESERDELKIKLLESESQTRDITKEVSRLKQYTEITELNRKIVTSLIQSIHISEPKKIDGEKTYDIEIRYKFHSPFNAKKEDTLSSNKVSSKILNAVE